MKEGDCLYSPEWKRPLYDFYGVYQLVSINPISGTYGAIDPSIPLKFNLTDELYNLQNGYDILQYILVGVFSCLDPIPNSPISMDEVGTADDTKKAKTEDTFR